MSAIIYAGIRYPISGDEVTAQLWTRIIECSAKAGEHLMVWTGAVDGAGDDVRILLGPGIPIALHLSPVADKLAVRPSYDQALAFAHASDVPGLSYLARTAEMLTEAAAAG